MTSYFRSWLGAPFAESESDVTIEVSPPLENDNDDEGSDTATEGDNDKPPAFPSPFSAQRIKSTPNRLLADSQLMPPPPIPQRALGASSSNLSVLATTSPPKKPPKSRKVALAPGHSPLDWAALKSSGEDLRGVDTLMRITPSVLKLHNKKEDAWTAIYGKVYNITPYLAFHPGGERELMRAAGRDGTKLFSLTHSWVNADFMLDACHVGFLVSESFSS